MILRIFLIGFIGSFVSVFSQTLAQKSNQTAQFRVSVEMG